MYVCYLLAAERYDRTYIGITTDPARRLREHNGLIPSKDRTRATRALRPWRMVGYVTGLATRSEAQSFEKGAKNPRLAARFRRTMGVLNARKHVLQMEMTKRGIPLSRWVSLTQHP